MPRNRANDPERDLDVIPSGADMSGAAGQCCDVMNTIYERHFNCHSYSEAQALQLMSNQISWVSE